MDDKGSADLILDTYVAEGDVERVRQWLAHLRCRRHILHKHMHRTLRYCPNEFFAPMLEVWQQAGADLDAIDMDTGAAAVTLLEYACKQWKWHNSCGFGEYYSGSLRWAARVHILIDAGATLCHDDTDEFTWVRERKQARVDTIRLKVMALAVAFHCLRTRWLLPRDVARFTIEPLARARMNWQEWRRGKE